jgi:stress-induced morphogen
VVVPTAEHLKERLEKAFPGGDVDVTGDDGQHFRAEIVSTRFEGLTRIQQHKLVHDVFGGDLGGAIHALSIKTATPEGTNGQR